MKQYLSLLLVPLFLFILFACNGAKSEGSQFVGKWIGTKSTSHILVITQDGKKFLIDEDLTSSSGEKLPHRQFVAARKDETLSFNHPVTSIPMQITYLKDFDFLTFDGQTFTRSVSP
jgi:hypothetical protein